MNGHVTKPHSAHTTRLPALVALALTLSFAGVAAGQGEAKDFLTPPADAAKSASGIFSQVITAGTGETYPSEYHLIAMHFIGYTSQGDKLYSSYDAGKALVMTLQTAFPPWREMLEQMVTGEKRRIWLPEHLVATSRGPRGASIFELELRGLKSIPRPPGNLEQAPEGAQSTPSGAATMRLAAGSGSEHPDDDSVVLVHYMGWTADGRSFDSSYNRGRPTAFPLDQIMPAFAETVQMMVAREKRQVWIPAAVARGNWVGSPEGPLVFEIELVKILPDDALKEMKPAGQAKPSGAGSP